MRTTLAVAMATGLGCADGDSPIVVVTFNTGTTDGIDHDGPPDDGYGSAEAAISDAYYGDGLAWVPVVEDTERFFAELQPDIVAFQEIFHPGECPTIPSELHAGFVCEGWSPGDPTVAQRVVGMGYQVACHQGKSDKCIAVRRAFGSIRGCDADVCMDFLAGAPVPDCGSGSRVGRALIDRVDGSELTVVSVHGTSGLAAADVACRVAQFEQVFVDLDGEPAANGEVNVVLGDLNTDPGRYEGVEESATRFMQLAAERGFTFASEVGRSAPRSYAGIVDIDHVLSDGLSGECSIRGITEGEPVSAVRYFDHAPVICALR